MEPIELYTKDGGYVTTLQVPRFNSPAEVIIWGQRVFVPDREAGRYREAFAYVVPLTKF